MKSNSEYRAIARQALEGRWTEVVLITLIYLLIACVFSIPAEFNKTNFVYLMSMNGMQLAATILLLVPFSYGFSNAILSILRNESAQGNALRDTWAFFKKDYSRSVPTLLLVAIVEFALGVVTLGIGMIILAYAYAMVPYLLRDYPDLTAREALRTSREMMKGHKWDLFVLQLSFIGWILLAIVTLGIGFLFVGPYMQTANAAFYEDLKAETIVEE